MKKPYEITIFTDPSSIKEIDNYRRKFYLDGLDRVWGKKNANLFFKRYPAMRKFASKREKKRGNASFFITSLYWLQPLWMMISFLGTLVQTSTYKYQYGRFGENRALQIQAPWDDGNTMKNSRLPLFLRAFEWSLYALTIVSAVMIPSYIGWLLT